MTSTISRRQILSRSRDAGLDRYHQRQKHNRFAPYEDYEEMWFSHEHLFKDHIAEVLRKWEQIDDEIWAKMIFMSRNRRIAKAYVRVPAVIIDGTDNGFDGYRVGLNGFEDPFRDTQTDQLMNHIEKGCRIGIDDHGNILIKRYSQSNVFVKCYPLDYSRSCVDHNVIRSKGRLELHKKYVLFDMAKFELAMMEELKCAYPDRSKLEQQCIVVIAFVREHPESILDMPIYVMLINIVALDMLKSKLNPVIYQSVKTHRDKIKVPEFVSIFNQPEPECCNQEEEDNDDDDDDDPIYGQIGDNDYYGSTWTNQYETNERKNRSIRNYRENHNGPHSMPTIGTIRYHNRNDSMAAIQSSKPPKLPPRDKKKLSKQINTIKCARKCQNTSSRLVEIPSPDYNDHDRDEDQQAIVGNNRSSNIQRRFSPFRSHCDVGSKTETTTATATTTKQINRRQLDNIYGTIVANNNSHHHFGWRHKHRDNGPLSLSTDRYHLTTKWNNGLFGPSSLPCQNMDRSLRVVDSSLIHLDEDPYYSGLEARVTSNKLHNASMAPKMKGLNWMMRKVLSSNYINLLTSKRHKKKVPKSKSSNESSTDSDPYVSINDVYEPIYGYGGRISYGWPTMQSRLKP